MIFEALQYELSRFKSNILSSNILKIPELNRQRDSAVETHVIIGAHTHFYVVFMLHGMYDLVIIKMREFKTLL